MAVSDHFGDGRPGNRDSKMSFGTWMITLDLEVYIYIYSHVYWVWPASQHASDHQDYLKLKFR